MSKVCTKCGVEKEESEFSKEKKGKNGIRALCKECVKLQSRAYYLANLGKIRERGLAYRRANLEKIRELDRVRRQVNREKILEQQMAHRRANLEKILERNRAYHHANREKILEQQRTYHQALPDASVKNMLRIKNPPQELIELKRVQIQIQRFIKEKKEKNNA